MPTFLKKKSYFKSRIGPAPPPGKVLIGKTPPRENPFAGPIPRFWLILACLTPFLLTGSTLFALPEGREVAAGQADFHAEGSSLKITTSDKAINVFYPGGNGPNDIYFSADGKEAYVTCEFDDTLSVIDPTTFTTIATLDTGNMPSFITGIADKLFVSNFGDGTVSVLNKATRQSIATITVGLGPLGLSATKDGKWLFVACHSANQIAIIDVDNLQVTARIPTQPGPSQVLVHPGQEYAIVTTDGIGSVQKLDLKTNQIVKTIPLAQDAGTQGAAFTNKGLLLVTNTGSSTITIVDSDSGVVVCSVAVPFAPKGIAYKNP